MFHTGVAMPSPSRVRVYLGCSFDGFIAGPDDDLGWLGEDHGGPTSPEAHPEGLQFDQFMEQVGSLLMGRRTYDVVAGMGQWIYGETPVLVATSRPLEPIEATVLAVSGDIRELVTRAQAVAGDKDVYLDGGDLVRQALDARLVDELCLTFIPILLGGGTRLFDGLLSRTSLDFVGHHPLGGGMLQVTATVRR